VLRIELFFGEDAEFTDGVATSSLVLEYFPKRANPHISPDETCALSEFL
jgi:hypothetical protein